METFISANNTNFECNTGLEHQEGVPQMFGFNFEPKGNFTFTWDLAVS
jgi:hypothetical protein